MPANPVVVTQHLGNFFGFQQLPISRNAQVDNVCKLYPAAREFFLAAGLAARWTNDERFARVLDALEAAAIHANGDQLRQIQADCNSVGAKGSDVFKRWRAALQPKDHSSIISTLKSPTDSNPDGLKSGKSGLKKK